MSHDSQPAGTGDEYVAGGAAYFAHVNAKGAIYGRKIRVVVKDDSYKPDQTVAPTRAMLAEDKPVALFGFCRHRQRNGFEQGPCARGRGHCAGGALHRRARSLWR